MLLIDVEAWRREGLGRKLLDWIAANPDKISLADQDAINAVLSDALTPLPERWNLQVGLNSGPLPEERLARAALLHYNGPRKPWEYGFRGPGADLFRAQKRQSPWRYKPPASRLAYRLRKSLAKRLARQSGGATALSQSPQPIQPKWCGHRPYRTPAAITRRCNSASFAASNFTTLRSYVMSPLTSPSTSVVCV